MDIPKLTNLKISDQLVSKFNQFKRESSFVDCYLCFSDQQYPCHRIILAKYSQWFSKYFDEHPSNDRIQKVEIPWNPNNFMDTFLDFIYTQEISISIKTIIPILSIASYYQFTQAKSVLMKYFKDCITETNALLLSKSCINLNLIEESYILVTQISQLLLNADNSKPQLRQQIFSSICPFQLAKILSHAEFSAKTNGERISLIDEYFERHEPPTFQEREILSTVINWNSSDSLNFYTNHKCHFFSFSNSRKLINTIINNRRESMKNFKKEIDQFDTSASRWYIFSWLNSIGKSSKIDAPPIINISHFFSTLGGIVPEFNPHNFGLINILSTRPLSKYFAPEKIL